MSFFDRFRKPASAPETSITLPAISELPPAPIPTKPESFTNNVPLDSEDQIRLNEIRAKITGLPPGTVSTFDVNKTVQEAVPATVMGLVPPSAPTYATFSAQRRVDGVSPMPSINNIGKSIEISPPDVLEENPAVPELTLVSEAEGLAQENVSQEVELIEQPVQPLRIEGPHATVTHKQDLQVHGDFPNRPRPEPLVETPELAVGEPMQEEATVIEVVQSKVEQPKVVTIPIGEKYKAKVEEPAKKGIFATLRQKISGLYTKLEIMVGEGKEEQVKKYEEKVNSINMKTLERIEQANRDAQVQIDNASALLYKSIPGNFTNIKESVKEAIYIMEMSPHPEQDNPFNQTPTSKNPSNQEISEQFRATTQEMDPEQKAEYLDRCLRTMYATDRRGDHYRLIADLAEQANLPDPGLGSVYARPTTLKNPSHDLNGNYIPEQQAA